MIKKYKSLKQKLSSTIKLLYSQKLSKESINENVKSFLVLVNAILWTDKKIDKAELKIITSAIGEASGLSTEKISKYLQQDYAENKISKAAAILSSLNLEVKEALLQTLIEIASINDKYTKKEQEIVDLVRKEFSISEVHAYELWRKASKKVQKNTRIIESGAAIIVVLIIIFVFILTASLLLSVIFGLILAYFFLPLQRCLKDAVFSSKIFTIITRIISVILTPVTYPLKKLSGLLPKAKRLEKKPELSPKEQKDLKLIKLSCRTTVTLVILLVLGFMFTATLFSTKYFAYATTSLSHWARSTTQEYVEQLNQKQPQQTNDAIQKSTEIKDSKSSLPGNNTVKPTPPKPKVKDFVNALMSKVESLKPKVEKIPFFKAIKERVADFLKDPDSLKKLALFVLSKTGGIFSYTAGLIGTIVMLLMNLVFTLFFFAFFLSHMARFNSGLDEKATAGEHIVNGVLNSGWLPNTTRATRYGSIVILNNIFARLRAWVRGYLTIIIIETIFYVTTFLLIGVPYGAILGILAGLTILLPYIGPVISILLTVTVCLAIGSGGMVQILIVILLYLFMNGIIEQLFIYPAIVGTALGLNEFETIVFVLLGGIVAGIPGLIFAVPIASILKYLIPQIYKFWQNRRNKNSPVH